MAPMTRIACALLLGIPGVAVLAYAGTQLVTATGSLSSRTLVLFIFLGGAVMALAGFGRLRQPLYAACFLPLPFLLIWTIELQQTGSWVAWIAQPAILLWPVLTYQWCARYYRRRSLDLNKKATVSGGLFITPSP